MKVLCVGSNYAHHAREMGGAVPRTPIWFWKPDSAIVYDGEPVVLPHDVGAVHHEAELAVRLGMDARRVSPANGRRCIDAFTIAVDVTARDLQQQAKHEGRPWAQAKGFDTFLPLGNWVDATYADLQTLRLRLELDGRIRQDGYTRDMTWDAGMLVSLASQWTTLRTGDVLLTGTPEGVGPLEAGQTMRALVVDHVTLCNPIIAA